MFDPLGMSQIELLKIFGLRSDHYVLDIGCGALAGGKYLIPYLEPGHYFGIEPQQWLIDAGIKYELGRRNLDLKRPVFSNDDEFNLSLFGQQFDFLLAHSIFSHATQVQIQKALHEAAKVMRPSGVFATSYMKGETDYHGDVWLVPGVCEYTPKRMEEFVTESGLRMIATAWPHTGQVWLAVFHPENAAFVAERVKAVNEHAKKVVLRPDPEGPAWYRAMVKRMRADAA
jgi:SAM-dependent methyltransferase